MITKEDINTIEGIKEIIIKMVDVGENDIDWEKVKMLQTLDKLVSNLKIADVSYQHASKEDIENNYYTAECYNCGWWGSSRLLNGGDQIADTGCYGDSYCPVCDDSDIDEK